MMRKSTVFNRSGICCFFHLNFLFDHDSGIGGLEFTAEPGNGGQNPQVVQGAGPQVHTDPADFFNGPLDDRDDILQRGVALGIPFFVEMGQDQMLDPVLDGAQILPDSVVQFLGNPFPFIFLGQQHLGGK